MNIKKIILFLLFPLWGLGGLLFAEDGSRLWLRFSDVKASNCEFSGIVGNPNSFAVTEFQMTWNEITKSTLPHKKAISDNSLIIGNLKNKSISYCSRSWYKSLYSSR